MESMSTSPLVGVDRLSTDGKLYAFDQDPDALDNALDDPRFTLVASNFRFFPKYLKLHGVKAVDGILADLGVSSHQIDEATRGFSTRFTGELDMRMDQKGEKTAASVINNYPEDALIRMFSAYGEIKNSRTLARAIGEEREIEPFTSTDQFKEIIRPLARRGKRSRGRPRLCRGKAEI